MGAWMTGRRWDYAERPVKGTERAAGAARADKRVWTSKITPVDIGRCRDARETDGESCSPATVSAMLSHSLCSVIAAPLPHHTLPTLAKNTWHSPAPPLYANEQWQPPPPRLAECLLQHSREHVVVRARERGGGARLVHAADEGVDGLVAVTGAAREGGCQSRASQQPHPRRPLTRRPARRASACGWPSHRWGSAA
jgi:hypothetical protein